MMLLTRPYPLAWIFYAFICMASISGRLSARDMKRMSLTEAADELKTLGGAGPAHEFVLEAIKENRLDVLELCLDDVSSPAPRYFDDEMEKMADSGFKNRMLLMILKSPLTNIRLEDTGLRSNEDGRVRFAKWFVPMLNKTLPDVPMEYSAVSTPDKRMMLAVRMEKILGIAPDYESAKRVWPPKPGEKREENSISPRKDGSLTVPLPTATSLDEPIPHASQSGLRGSIAAAFAALAGLVSWLLLRSKGKGRKG